MERPLMNALWFGATISFSLGVGEQLAEIVHLAYGPVILQPGWFLLAQEHHECVIEEVETPCIQCPQSIESIHDAMLYNSPGNLVKMAHESHGQLVAL